MGYIDIKSLNARKFLVGEPLLLVKQGKIMEQALRKSRLDLDSLRAMLRQKDVFSMADVEYAIFETDGKISVMKKESGEPLTKGDMNIENRKKEYPLPTAVILDGNINIENLKRLHLSTDWLQHELLTARVNSVSDVFYAEIQPDGTLFIDCKIHSYHH
ncbi:uncharacterized membrane protein YcaP (DUF421 family) [Bacillus niacini]|uniref:Uncharacterized membrane protein YcaP (DUF421 family) n=1 Tax=Neobacillus niacini TaxID=86668 RepID=A0A852TJF2_9BACI|nr:YetF domain-containing protein [Neobacillus niacini]NYE08305.1 uncharacterized membrane protein YcaP (DUF421 family) [Neobacillus niacini]